MAKTGNTGKDKPGALDGLKVVDLSWYAVGPFTCKYLAEHGAEVVRIESLVRPDGLRGLRPFKDGKSGVNRSGRFALFNNDKYSITLNLGKPEAREVLKRLVRWADIVVEGFGKGTVENWGLDYDNLKQLKPDIIMVSTSMQGRTGPGSGAVGFGIELGSTVGFTNFIGWPDREVVAFPLAYTDFTTPSIGIVAIMAALETRRRTGKGQYIDLAQIESGGLPYLATPILDYTVNGRVGGRMGNSHAFAAPHGAYPCHGEERWCAIAVFTDKEWQDFCEVIGKPSWSDDPRFATVSGRKQNETELDGLIGEWTVNYTAEEVAARMQSMDIAAGVVENGEDLHKDAQLKHRRHFRTLNHPEMGPCAYDAPCFRLSRTPAKLERPAPCLGEHTEHVCREILGMEDEEFIELLQIGAFE